MDAARAARVAEERTRLREAGLRATRQRTAVLVALRDLDGHVSADELLAELRRSGEPVSRMTVYHALADLEAATLVMRADAGPGRALYEAADEWHHHFVCRSCRRVVDVPCVTAEKPCIDASVPGTVDEAQIIFRGVCDRCRG